MKQALKDIWKGFVPIVLFFGGMGLVIGAFAPLLMYAWKVLAGLAVIAICWAFGRDSRGGFNDPADFMR